ncbi:hypothetical protein ANO11243_092680 [Dothideomycetidae sp. 11243]|nr:hypothetical protein ANO11243_092680 [fungal sp. No.11243]
MLFSTSLLAVVTSLAAGVAAAGRPANTTICDFYTTAVFKENNSTNQRALVAAVVNRAATGNTTANPMLTGILNPGTFNNAPMDITPFFFAQLNSTNTGGGAGFSVSFVDGGGLAALKAGMPATDTTSNQFTLFTHLYAYFGSVLGCSGYSSAGYPPYIGKPSMFEVHKFMGLKETEIGYFNEQVGLSALSLGVTADDQTIIVNLLNSVFNNQCGPKTTIIKAQGAQLQSFCLDATCPKAKNATDAQCKKYPMEPKPQKHSSTAASSMCSLTSTMASSASSKAISATTTSKAMTTTMSSKSMSSSSSMSGSSKTSMSGAAAGSSSSSFTFSSTTKATGATAAPDMVGNATATTSLPAMQTTNAAPHTAAFGSLLVGVAALVLAL